MSAGLYTPGAAQSAPLSNRAAGAVGGGGYIEPVVKRQPLARVNASGTTRTTVSVAARILNPAARLICSFSLSFEPDQPQPFSNFNSAVWSCQGIRSCTR